jgi:glycosyltransferase involved in cell wall biosynthesis
MKKTLKVLLVNTRHFYGGGDSTYTFNLAELLLQNGHEVAFFAMQDQRNLPDPNDDLFVSPIDFRELNLHKNLGSGLRVITRTIYSREARINFSILLDRFSPDIVHLQNYLLHITPSILYEINKRGLPVVWTLHDYYLACPNSHFIIDRTGEICEACRGGHFYHALKKCCKKDSLLASGMAAFVAYCNQWMSILRKIDAFLSPSLFLKNKMLESNFDEKKIHHVPLFLPRKKFWESDQSQRYLLFLGKLERIKGIEVLIEAAKKAGNVTIKMAGSVSEPLASQLSAILPSNAEYVGLKYGQDLVDLTHKASALILPSIWYENQPFSILEAFASSKPVIASNLGGMTELVADHERGLLVEPGNPIALADAMEWAVTNRSEMKEMGKNAYQYAQANHSPEFHYQALMDIYDQVRSGQVTA